ncbi:MAG: M14 family zinc carboxypeptidase, partial [Planctomycetota bacterium]
MSITVDTAVPYGNACDISVTREKDITIVSFAPEPHGGPEVMWFCFRVKRKGARAKRARKLRLVLKNLASILGGNDAASLRPVAAGPDGNWRRLDGGTAEELPDGRVNVVWTIKEPESLLDVALCYPYGAPQVQALVAETKDFYRTDVIGVSQGGRPIVRLSNDYGAKNSKRPALYLVARQHSGETPGSWVLDGFLRRAAALGDKAPLVWAVPLTNIDGVESGDYGKDNFPHDLNRAWGQPPMRHEVL